MDLYLLKKADGSEYGPLTADQVRQCVQAGHAFARTLIRREGEAAWQQLAERPEFSEALRQAVNPATPAPAPFLIPPNPPPPSEESASTAGDKWLLRTAGLALFASFGAFFLLLAELAEPLAVVLFLLGFVCTVGTVVGFIGTKIRRHKVPRPARNLGCAAIILWFLIIAMAAPSNCVDKTMARKNACINNLRQIDGAKEQWALENKKTATDTPTWNDLIGADKYIKIMPTCPANGTYTINNMVTKPRCSIPDHTLP